MVERKLSGPDPRLQALLAEYPPGLFNNTLYQSIQLAHRYTLALVIEVLTALELSPLLTQWQTSAALCQERGLPVSFAWRLGWLLEYAVAYGAAERQMRQGEVYYRASLLPSAESAPLRAELLAVSAANAPTVALLEAAAALYPAVARGACSGEEGLMGMGNIEHWLAFFSADNLLYSANNRVCALALARALAERPRLRLLELGAGAGSGSLALLAALAEQGQLEAVESYLITEPSPFLRRRAERALKQRYPKLPLRCLPLDLNAPWADQLPADAPAAFELIFGVNVLHLARDLPSALAEARRHLAPQGWLAAGECLRPFDQPPRYTPIYVEFALRLLESFGGDAASYEQWLAQGFLTPERWLAGFRSAGFESVAITPDHRATRDYSPLLLIGTVLAQAPAAPR